ncbi:MAG: hypothetical protein ACYC4U_11190 [Pirellulaceae bacterium]
MLVRIGIDAVRAGEYGRRVGVALAHGNWEEAHGVVDEAQRTYESETTAVEDARRVNLASTTIPIRTVAILEAHGFFTVGDLLLVSIRWISAQRQMGRATMDVVLECLREIGITPDDFAGD